MASQHRNPGAHGQRAARGREKTDRPPCREVATQDSGVVHAPAEAVEPVRRPGRDDEIRATPTEQEQGASQPRSHATFRAVVEGNRADLRVRPGPACRKVRACSCSSSRSS